MNVFTSAAGPASGTRLLLAGRRADVTPKRDGAEIRALIKKRYIRIDHHAEKCRTILRQARPEPLFER